MEYKHENVLLLGNGISLTYGGITWNKLLEAIDKREDRSVKPEDLNIPEPLKAVYVTGDHVGTAMKDKKELLFGEIKQDEQMQMLKDIISIDFDHFLTTNYSYELEFAAVGKNSLSESELRKMLRHTDETKKSETKYRLHTYNEAAGKKIWHIHGEARNPDTMLLGHYYYGKTLFKINEIAQKRKGYYERDQKSGKPTEIKSWVDAFIMGNLYILGLGFAFSEFDLWWLLNRRKREKAETGKLVFYERISEKNREKIEMLRLMGVEVRNLGFDEKCDYEKFYRAAIADMQQDIAGQKTPRKELAAVK